MTHRTGYLLSISFWTILAVVLGLNGRAAAEGGPASALTRLDPAGLELIAPAVEAEIQAGRIPGAVVLVGQGDDVMYRRAFGFREVVPQRVPMTEDTVFDLASLTKVAATTTAVMQLVEEGKIGLDRPAAAYWPAFRGNGKAAITVRQLLTHYSGLRADLPMKKKWSGYDQAMKRIVAERPVSRPGSRYLYSDINFAVLGELVRRVSGQPLDVYCNQKIYGPLEMSDTAFRPTSALRDRIAPTERTGDGMLRGVVHDPMARRMGGVAGHAGLFSTADNLAVYARMLLNGGIHQGRRILDSKTVNAMSTIQSPAGKSVPRGLGFQLDAPFVSNRSDLSAVGAFGHTGYTGTSLWIDPVTKTYAIILTHRVHPNGRGDVAPLRTAIAKLVSAAAGPLAVTGVRTGIDVLEADRFAPLAGLRVGLITNHSGLDATGRRTIDLIRAAAKTVTLSVLFSPEHGLSGTLDEKIASGREPTGLRVFSLYGDVKRPTPQMLKGIDALVFDVQDAGVRFYTYISTMAYAMEAASRKGIPFFVLDRPNPINADRVLGPILDSDLKSFTGYFSLPVQYGMTPGELAVMFNAENNIGADLRVIRMTGYERRHWYDETGLHWVGPSPNLRTLTQTTLYPGVALVEGANVSVGRGTDRPFEILGAPWIDGPQLAEYLRTREIQGVEFEAAEFTPSSDRYKGRLCRGVRIRLSDREALDAPSLGVEIASALTRLYPKDFELDRTLGLIGAREVVEAIRAGRSPDVIMATWQDDLERFRGMREKYLLY